MLFSLGLVLQYSNEGVVDVVRYICELRQDRGGMVQTKVSLQL